MSLTTVTSHALAVTTPFVQSGSCANLWKNITVPDTNVTIRFSNTADPQYASCQPSGWNVNGKSNPFTFSPAVCPSGWDYYDMAATTTTTTVTTSASTGNTSYTDYFASPTRTVTYSAAWCCAHGFWPYVYSEPYITTLAVHPCISDLETMPTDTWIGVHEAWHVTWEASDTSTLSPSLPSLTSFMLVPSWTPGMVIYPGEYDNYDANEHSNSTGESEQSHSDEDDDPALEQLAYFLEIGLPLICIAAISGIGFGIYKCCRFRSQQRLQARLMSVQGQGAASVAVDVQGLHGADCGRSSAPPQK